MSIDMPNRNFYKRSGGFTLVELLVVMAILALLYALVVPTIQSAMLRGRSAKCLTQLRQWSNAIFLYTTEHDEYLPSSQRDDRPSQSGHADRPWTTATWHHYGQLIGMGKESMRCPNRSDNDQLIADNAVHRAGDWATRTVTLDSDDAAAYIAGYTPNSWWIRRDDRWIRFRPFRLGQIPQPSMVLMLADGDHELFGYPERISNLRFRHGSERNFIHVATFDGAVQPWDIQDCLDPDSPRYFAGGGDPPNRQLPFMKDY